MITIRRPLENRPPLSPLSSPPPHYDINHAVTGVTTLGTERGKHKGRKTLENDQDYPFRLSHYSTVSLTRRPYYHTIPPMCHTSLHTFTPKNVRNTCKSVPLDIQSPSYRSTRHVAPLSSTCLIHQEKNLSYCDIINQQKCVKWTMPKVSLSLSSIVQINPAI